MMHGGGVGFYYIEENDLGVAVPKTHDIEVSWLWARPKGLPHHYQVSSLEPSICHGIFPSKRTIPATTSEISLTKLRPHQN